MEPLASLSDLLLSSSPVSVFMLFQLSQRWSSAPLFLPTQQRDAETWGSHFYTHFKNLSFLPYSQSRSFYLRTLDPLLAL